MIVEEYERLPRLTDEEVKQQAEGIFNFLKLTHPYINNKKIFYKEGRAIEEQVNADSVCIEIRALRRDRPDRPYYRSFKLYRFADSELERLYKFLLELNNKEIPYCLYYSVYAFDNNRMAVNKQGKKSETWNNKIAINNAIATQILIADYDDITEDEFLLERLKLARLGIETLDVFSGHGFQSIILLDKLTEDKDLLKRFTNLMLKKGFRVDHKIKDCARIMRLPYTYNSKELSKTNIENPCIIKTFIYNRTEKRYNLEYVLERLNGLESVVELEEIKEVEEKEEKVVKTEVITENKVKNVIQLKDSLEDLTYNKERLTELYAMLDVDSLPEPVLKMLEGFRMGYANSMLLFLTLYLKEQGYSKSTIIEAMQVLSNQDRFNYPWDEEVVKCEVKRFYYSSYNWRGVFSDGLQQFGYVEYNLTDKSVITINNYVFNNLNKISSSAFYMYIMLLENQNKTGQSIYTINEIAEVTELSRRRVLEHLDDLCKVKILDKKRANRRLKEEYTYYISIFLKTDLGFTKINVATIKLLRKMIQYKEINTTILMLALYFKFVCYGGKKESNVSQETIAEALGVNQSTISRSVNKLEKVDLIHKEKEDISDFKYRYHYTIHY